MSIRYRSNRNTWQVYWTNPISKKRESKDFKTQKEAEKENARIQYLLEYEPERFIFKETLEEKPAPTLEQVYEEYLEEKNFSAENLEAHKYKLKLAIKLIGKLPVTDISRFHLEQVKSALLADKTLARSTVATRLSALRAVMYYANERGYCDAVQYPKIPSPCYQHFIPPTRAELATLFVEAPPHIQRVIVIGAFVGARVGECELLQLKWDDVDLDRAIMRIQGSKKSEIMPWREVPIAASILPLFQAWRLEDATKGISYLISYRGQSVKSIKTAWRSTLQRAGISRRIRPYDLRHAFATELVAAGVDIGTVAQLLGHSSPSMLLKHYQHVANAQKQRAIDSLPNLPNLPVFDPSPPVSKSVQKAREKIPDCGDEEI